MEDEYVYIIEIYIEGNYQSHSLDFCEIVNDLAYNTEQEAEVVRQKLVEDYHNDPHCHISPITEYRIRELKIRKIK